MGKSYRDRERNRWEDSEPRGAKLSPKDQANEAIEHELQRLVAQGRAEYLDHNFYAQFAGLEFQGVPLTQQLQDLNLGRCFDCSALLALAMDGKDGNDWQICRGVLERLNPAFKMEFRHGWAETGNYVYDTTWRAKVNRDDYYDLFQVKLQTAIPTQEYFATHPKESGWELRPVQTPERCL